MTASDQPQGTLPGAYIPILVRAAERLLRHSDAQGRLMVEPGRFQHHPDMDAISCLAVLLVTEHPENPHYRSDAVAALLGRAGRFLNAFHLDPAHNPPNLLWYEDRDIQEWVYEQWMTAYRLLRERGAPDLARGWEEGLRAGADTFYRYCREIEHVRTASSPNLSISPNHFAFFILNTLEAGSIFNVPEYRDYALELAHWLTRQQDCDGYWEETDGPTTHYNFITTGAVGWYYELTGDRRFLDAVRRSLDFHIRFAYPDGGLFETIDQRVRYRPPDGGVGWNFTWAAFSHFSEGRALNERLLPILEGPDLLHSIGRIAKAAAYYHPGDVAPSVPEFDRTHTLLSRAGGVLKDGAWAVGLCAIPSQPRPHRFTLDRHNLLSVWHKDGGLIIGGGNSRNHPHAATFHKRVPCDPQAIVDGVTEMDVYIPVRGSVEVHERTAALTAGYWGFDAQVLVDLLDDRRCRLTAGAWGRHRLMPITFTLNLRLVPGLPLRTASGRTVPIDGTAFSLAALEMGDWFGQGRWRITVPPGATLDYPFRPYYPTITPDKLPPDLLYGLLTVPISNDMVSVEVRVA